VSLRKIIITDPCFIAGDLAETGKVLAVEQGVATSLIQAGRARYATDTDAKPKPVVETAEAPPARENASLNLKKGK